ncbi:MAG TPA: universal stress protein [Methylomirabilota bacterium]|jgi:nucleotide-binding universal stress UspA family protein
MATRAGVRRVVVGVDGSSNSRRAAAFLARLKAPRGARVTCVQVVEAVRAPSTPLLPGGMRARLVGEVDAMNRERRRVASRRVAAIAAMLTRAGWRATGVVRTGAPLPELLAAVRRARADLLVVGARGAGAMTRLLLGSVAEGVVKQSPVPVLLVK